MATTTIEENERLAREHLDREWNHGEFDTDVLTDDYRVHLNFGGHETLTLEAFRGFVTESREAVPDLHKEPEDGMLAESWIVADFLRAMKQLGVMD